MVVVGLSARILHTTSTALCHCQPLLLITNIITVLITCPIPLRREWVIGSWYWVGWSLGCPLDGAGAPDSLGRINTGKVATGHAWDHTHLFMGQKPSWTLRMSREGGDRSATWEKCSESHQVCYAVENRYLYRLGRKGSKKGWNLPKYC